MLIKCWRCVMAVLLETNVGDIVVDLFVKEKPATCRNFIKLCKLKYYNFCLFYNVKPYFVAQTGDPTNSGQGGRSVYGICGGKDDSFPKEEWPTLKHSKAGTLSMVVDPRDDSHRSQFFFTLAANLTRLDSEHSPFGVVAEGLDVLLKLNDAILDENGRPLKDYRINRTIILDDPFDDPPRGFHVPDRSPSPTAQQLENFRIGAEEADDEESGVSKEEAEEKLKEQEARAQAQILELVGDLPSADVKPPENVLFVCKLNPVTDDDDLKLIFSRFGRITSCHVVRDPKTGDSLQYAFVEFENVADCEKAYLKMENVLIDDRRIHVDFSQSVAMQSKASWFKQYFQSKRPGATPRVPPARNATAKSYTSSDRHKPFERRPDRQRHDIPSATDKHSSDRRRQYNDSNVRRYRNSRERSRSAGESSRHHRRTRDSRERSPSDRRHRRSDRDRSRSEDRKKSHRDLQRSPADRRRHHHGQDSRADYKRRR